MLLFRPVLNTIDFPTLIGYNTVRTFSQPPVEYHRLVCILTNDLKPNHISNIDECNIEEKKVRNVQKNRVGENRVLPMFKSVRICFGSPFR